MDAIDELTEHRQWVCWKLLPAEPKPRKIPVCALTGQPASSTDPATWATLDDVIDACTRHPELAGAGFVFTADDPYTGVDLDACIDPDTGTVAPWAAAIVTSLASYTEFSPSGTGLHCIIRATVPAGGNRRGGIELYSTGRYFTMTALPLPGTPASITEAQRPLDAIHRELFGGDELVVQPRQGPKRRSVEPSDAALLERMFASPRGGQIRRLWDGDSSGYDHDDSRADLALVGHLQFWTGGDRDRADRLFRQSSLFRAKWDERRGANTYGDRTLNRAGSRAVIARGPIVA